MPNTLSEKIYYKMPNILQDVTFSMYGWYLARQRYNSYFDRYLENLKSTEWWPENKILYYQNMQMIKLLKYAYESVEFYHKWYDECGVDIKSVASIEDLNRLPILTKQLVRKSFGRMVSSNFSKRHLYKSLTSGTTGTPLTVYQTKAGLAFQWAIWWRHKARFGLSTKDRYLTLGARIPVSQTQSTCPYWRKDFINNRVYMSTYHISKRTVKDIVSYLNATNFDFFTGYPSAMYSLANLISEAGLKLYNKPKYIISGSDALLPKYEMLISKIFGAPVTEQYGMSEFAGNMSKCEFGNYHVDFECCYVEALPIEKAGVYKILLTGWGNKAMPFIRYEVGDFGVPRDCNCACGRKSLYFESIDGRLEDYIITPDGRKIIGMNQVFEYAKNAREIQIYQKTPERVEFRIVPGRAFGKKDKEALTTEFRRRAGSKIVIQFNIVNELQRSASGKLKAVISDVSAQ
ncbi:MAG: hypothetical protein K9K66_10980 [Desulfarculaceae bacterium]|nr:hypothetical protein [Desulfarculaceae bacterium]MCF8118284.1 hypothetical protein [Desulfarculaceae bacterium]